MIVSNNILHQESENQKYKYFYSKLDFFIEKSTDRFSDLVDLKKEIDALTLDEKGGLIKSMQSSIKKIEPKLSSLNKKLFLEKEDDNIVEIMSQIRKYKILHESLEMLLMSEEQIENIRQTSRRFQKKAQSSVVPEKYLK